MNMAEAVSKLRSKSLTRPELEELTKHFFPLAKNMAKKYGRKGDIDEFITAGYEGIEYALRKAPEKMYDDNLELWVKSCIYRFVRRYKVTSHVLCVPNTSLRRAEAQGDVTRMMESHPLLENDLVMRQSTRYQELVVVLEESALDEVDLGIIQLRVQGFSDQEIGEQLGKSNSDIHRRRKRMEDVFNSLMRGQKSCDSSSSQLSSAA
jgi:hypothetical protein